MGTIIYDDKDIEKIIDLYLDISNVRVANVKWEFVPKLSQGDRDKHILTLDTIPITEEMRKEEKEQADNCARVISQLFKNIADGISNNTKPKERELENVEDGNSEDKNKQYIQSILDSI